MAKATSTTNKAASAAAPAADKPQGIPASEPSHAAPEAPAPVAPQGGGPGIESLSEGTGSASAPGAEAAGAGHSAGQEDQANLGGPTGDGQPLTGAPGEEQPAGASPAPVSDALNPGAQSELEAAEAPARSLVMPLDDAVEGVWVRSIPETFRRAGFRFDRHGVGIALDSLTDEQLDQLVEEPNLIVEFTAFSDQVLE